MLGGIPDFAPEAGNLDQDHYDDLGVWLANPLTPFGSRAMDADLAPISANPVKPPTDSTPIRVTSALDGAGGERCNPTQSSFAGCHRPS